MVDRPRRLRRSERGSTLVEAALLTPLFFLLLFGIIDWGLTMHDRLSVADMSTSGARSGSSQGDEPLADFFVLRAMEKSSGAVSAGQIRMMVVYRASGPNGTVPAACRTGTVTGTCNRYTAADFTRPESDFGCTGPPGPAVKADRPWCPTSRKVALGGPGGPPDHLGVYVEAEHEHFVGFFGSPKVLRSNTVIRLEPRKFQ